MADQNNDRMSSTSGMRSTPEDSGLAGRSGSQQSAGMTTDSLKASGSRMADDAKHYAQDMAGRAKEQGRSMFEEQKHGAVEQVGSVADALHSTAEQLSGEGQPQMGRYIGMAAEQLESFARDLRHKNMDTVLRDVEGLARRSPGVFFAGSVMAGFLFSRFLKSSAQRQYDRDDYEQYGADMDYDDELAYATYTDDRFDTSSPAYSSTGRSAGLDPVAGPMGDGTPSSGASGSSATGSGSSLGTTGTTGSSAGGMTGSTSGTGSTGAGTSTTGTSTTGSSSTDIGADGTGTGPLSSSSSGKQPGGNTYGNR